MQISTTQMQSRLERKLLKTTRSYFSVCVAVSFCRWMCIYFHNAAAMFTSADVIQRIFSFAVQLEPLCSIEGGAGACRNHNCFHSLVKRQLLDHPLQPWVSVCLHTHVWGCVCTCVCVLHTLTLCMHLHRQLHSDPQSQWDNVHTGLWHLNHYR